MENNANQLNTNLCKKNCGFFGNPAFDGYCSKCYKDHVKRQNSGSASGRLTPTSVANNVIAQQQQQQALNNLSNQLITSNNNNNTNTNSNNEIPLASSSSSSSNNLIITLSNNNNNVNNEIMNVNMNINNSEKIADQCVAIESAKADVTAAATATAVIASPAVVSVATEAPASLTVEDSTTASSSANENDKKKRNRCMVDSCKRKLGLTGFDCRCGGLYCWEHRYSDKHSCQFDYKELGQDQIRKNNPVVVGEKIQKL